MKNDSLVSTRLNRPATTNVEPPYYSTEDETQNVSASAGRPSIVRVFITDTLGQTMDESLDTSPATSEVVTTTGSASHHQRTITPSSINGASGISPTGSTASHRRLKPHEHKRRMSPSRGSISSMASTDSHFNNGFFGASGLSLGASKPVSGVINSDIAGPGMFDSHDRVHKMGKKKY